MFNQYQPNLDNLQNYLSEEAEKQRGDGPNWWSVPAGTSVVRILPPWDPTGRIALPVYSHPIEFKGKDMSYTKYTWTCTSKTLGKPCSICEGLTRLANTGVDISKYEANSRKFYFNAIVLNDPDYNPAKNEGTAPGTHVLMKAPKTFYDWVIAQITNPMIGDITSVTNGIDVMITKSGKGLDTTYSMTTSPNGRTAVPQEYLDKIESLYNLDDIFSTGFEQSQVDELMITLSSSANTMGQFVNNTVAQMQAPMPPVYPQGGWNYQQTPVPQQMVTPQPMPQVPPMQTAPVAPVQPVSAPVAQAPQSAPLATSQAPTQPVAPSASDNLPKCYGNYNAGNVSCVVCPMELKCSGR